MQGRRDQISGAAAWLLWMLLQAGVLALFAWRVPLAANFPTPMEDHAHIALVLTQLIAAAALAPVLLRSVYDVACAVAGAVPMIVLAHLLAGQAWASAAPVVLIAWAWLIAMRFITAAPLRALLLLTSVAGPVLVYLINEYTAQATPAWLIWVSPPLGAVSVCLRGWGEVGVILIPALVAGAGFVVERTLRKSKSPVSDVEPGPADPALGGS